MNGYDTLGMNNLDTTQMLLPVPENDRRDSFSDSDIFSYLSGIDSPIPPLQSAGTLSPHSSASPSSAFSYTPEDLLNAFNAPELNLLFHTDPIPQDKPLFYPNFQFPLQNYNVNPTIPPQWMQNPVMKQDDFSIPPIPSQPIQLQSQFQPQTQVQSQTQDSILTQAKTQANGKSAPKRRRKAVEEEEEPVTGVGVGKHNKTERRYRQKVQAAQADLRDSVPALRVLYGTSTEEQKQTTDKRLPDGTVDGLGEIARPNSSAKATIFVGAKLYIELLQRRVAKLERKVGELEQFRSAVAGQEDLEFWRNDFNSRQIEEPISTPPDYDDDEDDEQQPLPKKKSKTAMKAFASFAMVFSFLPSRQVIPTSTLTSEDILSSSPSTTQVISRLPLITAEHTSRFLARGLPSVVVPTPHALVVWTWRLILTAILAYFLGPILNSNIVSDAFKLFVRPEDPVEQEVVQQAGAIVGNVKSASLLERLRVELHLRRAKDADSLAILALLTKSEQCWLRARSLKSTPALELSLDEALTILSQIPPTPYPLPAIIEHVHLVHLNDMYNRFFTQLVTSSTESGSTLRDLRSNLFTHTVTSTPFEKELRGLVGSLPQQTPAHALSLVLVGLWGIFAGASSQAQATLAAALGSKDDIPLASVSAMLSLLYGIPFQKPSSVLTSNILAVDRIALVCVEYVKLVTLALAEDDITVSTTGSASRFRRLEYSTRIRNITTSLRLALVETHIEEDELDGKVIEAKEKLVSVLSNIARRAAGRVTGRDEDSGIDGDLEEI